MNLLLSIKYSIWYIIWVLSALCTIYPPLRRGCNDKWKGNWKRLRMKILWAKWIQKRLGPIYTTKPMLHKMGPNVKINPNLDEGLRLVSAWQIKIANNQLQGCSYVFISFKIFITPKKLSFFMHRKIVKQFQRMFAVCLSRYIITRTTQHDLHVPNIILFQLLDVASDCQKKPLHCTHIG